MNGEMNIITLENTIKPLIVDQLKNQNEPGATQS